jgi:ribosomal-protein-serine acetyltransferase
VTLPGAPAELPNELRGPRVIVRPFQAGDGAAVFEAVEESRQHILPWMPWGDFHRSIEDSEAFAIRCALAWETRDDLAVGIWDVQTGSYLGGSGLHRIRWEIPAFEIGYWIRASAEGKGYVTEAAQLLCGLAFDNLNAARVLIRCAIENERSAAIPRRLGFKHEGILRNEIRDAYHQLHDCHIFSMIPEEWQLLSP